MAEDKKNLNIARIPTSLTNSRNNFYRYWLEIMRPMHKLTSREIEVLALLLFKRLELSRSIIDSDMLDQIVLSTEVRKQIREELGLSTTHLHVVLTKFKKANIIVNSKINKKFLPNVDPDSKEYKLILLFDFSK